MTHPSYIFTRNASDASNEYYSHDIDIDCKAIRAVGQGEPVFRGRAKTGPSAYQAIKTCFGWYNSGGNAGRCAKSLCIVEDSTGGIIIRSVDFVACLHASCIGALLSGGLLNGSIRYCYIITELAKVEVIHVAFE